MDGLIIVNKPQGLTSHDVCEKIKRFLHSNKVGHTGTLDPMATGVLVVAVGKATKLIQYLENHEKTYLAEALLGTETDTYDILGKILSEKKIENVNEVDIKNALGELKDMKMQIPPIYSAIKVNGKKLYDYALKNQDVEIKPRPIDIKKLDLIEVAKKDEKWYIKLVVQANKGFYVRSLIHDLGIKLNTTATMSELTRLKAGNYDLSIAQNLEEIEKNPKIISIEEIFKDYPQIEVSDYLAKLTRNGIQFDERQYSGNQLFKVYHNDKLIAIYAPCGEKIYKPVVFMEE